MRKLAAPLRVTWDWDRPPVAHPGASPRRPTPEIVRLVGSEIVRARILILEVGYPDADAFRSGEIGKAIMGFSGAISIALSPATALELRDERPWEALGAAEVWLDATPVGGRKLPEELESWPAVRIYLTASNVEQAARHVIRAVERGATALSLPNLPLFGEILRDAAGWAPPPDSLRIFAGQIAPALTTHPGIDLRVHHYGLWEALRARGLRPQGETTQGNSGCQAGTALAYIDPTGIIYPCASLPVPLERIGEGALARAWAGEEITVLRQGIARLPSACSDCSHGGTCRGGCRGWARFLAGNWENVGPDCSRG